DALGTDQAHDLLDFVEQRFRGLIEKKVGLVEEEHELRLRRIANLRQFLEQLRQEPQQEGRVQARIVHELVGSQHIDQAALGFGVDAHQVRNVERGLAEELRAALVLKHQKLTLH